MKYDEIIAAPSGKVRAFTDHVAQARQRQRYLMKIAEQQIETRPPVHPERAAILPPLEAER